jgi:hypothetical protein
MWLLVCVIIVCIAFSADFRRVGAKAFFSTANVVRDLALLAMALLLVATFMGWMT